MMTGNEIDPILHRKQVENWLRSVQSVTSRDNPVDRQRYVEQFFHSWTYIALYFQPDTAQKMFRNLDPDHFLPGELIAAAFHHENGASPDQLREMACDGTLSDGPLIAHPHLPGQIVMLSLREHGHDLFYVTGNAVETDPAAILHCAMDCARRENKTVHESLEQVRRVQGAPPLLTMIVPETAALMTDSMSRTAAVGAIHTCDYDNRLLLVAENSRLLPDNPGPSLIFEQ